MKLFLDLNGLMAGGSISRLDCSVIRPIRWTSKSKIDLNLETSLRLRALVRFDEPILRREQQRAQTHHRFQ